jgi:hypothetical protein
MKTLMNMAFIGLMALSTTAIAGKGKHKPAKKAHTVETCTPDCPHPCPQEKGA